MRRQAAESNVESPHSHVKRHLGTGRDRASPLDWKYCPNSSFVRRLPPVVDYNERVLSGVVDTNSPMPLRGDHGYGYLPYAFLVSSDLTWDFWTMRRVS
jgi:hypothetical protein